MTMKKAYKFHELRRKKKDLSLKINRFCFHKTCSSNSAQQLNEMKIKPHLNCNYFHSEPPNGSRCQHGSQIQLWKNEQNEYLTIYHAHMLIYLNKQFDKCPAWMIYILYWFIHESFRRCAEKSKLIHTWSFIGVRMKFFLSLLSHSIIKSTWMFTTN